MGGAEHRGGRRDRDILLEARLVGPRRIRRTRRALGMSTEASYRFERGIDRWDGAEAMRRCIELVLATAGGTLADAPLDLWPEPSHPPRIFLRPARVAQVLGVELPWHALETYLVAIGATVVSSPTTAGSRWTCRAGARISSPRSIWSRRLPACTATRRSRRTSGRSGWAACPMRRSRPRSPRCAGGWWPKGCTRSSALPLGPAEGDGSVRLMNPLSADDAWLRRRLLPGLVRLVEANWANHVADVRLFEIGTAFAAARPGSGRAKRVGSPACSPVGASRPLDRHRNRAASISGISRAGSRPRSLWRFLGGSVQVERNRWVALDAAGRAAGEAGPLEADAPPWAAPLYGFEMRLDPAPRRPPRFIAAADDSAVERVLALLLPDGVRGGGEPRAAASWRRLCWSGCRWKAIIGGRSCRREPEASPSDSRSGPPTGRCATPTWTQIEARILAALAEELGVRRRDAGTARGGE